MTVVNNPTDCRGFTIIQESRIITLLNKEIDMLVTFRLVLVGEFFKMNGNTYVKKSSRTAAFVMPNFARVGVFYVGQTEACEVVTL
jgi:hypothetical protein